MRNIDPNGSSRHGAFYLSLLALAAASPFALGALYLSERTASPRPPVTPQGYAAPSTTVPSSTVPQSFYTLSERGDIFVGVIIPRYGLEKGTCEYDALHDVCAHGRTTVPEGCLYVRRLGETYRACGWTAVEKETIASGRDGSYQ